MEQDAQIELIKKRVLNKPTVRWVRVRFRDLIHVYELTETGWRLRRAGPSEDYDKDVRITDKSGRIMFLGSWEELIKWN